MFNTPLKTLLETWRQSVITNTLIHPLTQEAELAITLELESMSEQASQEYRELFASQQRYYTYLYVKGLPCNIK